MSTVHTNELKTIDGTKNVQVADIADGNVGIGVGQTWQDVTASREFDVVYTNDTGRPIMIRVIGSSGSSTGWIQLAIYANGVNFGGTVASGSEESPQTYGSVVNSLLIPSGATYKVTLDGVAEARLHSWWELREVV